MEFDRYTLALLVTNPDAPDFDDEEAARLQDAHLSHLADLYAGGHLLAVGPLADPDGRVVPWTLPAGLLQFTPGRLPRSVAEVRD